VKSPPTICLFQEMTESCILHLYFNDEGRYTSNSFYIKSQLTVFSVNLRCRVFYKLSALSLPRRTSKSYTYLHFGDVMALVLYWL